MPQRVLDSLGLGQQTLQPGVCRWPKSVTS